MIKLESAHIEEVRGIRKLEIDLQMKSFAISGPNGSGKSGIIDAVEFALTGHIGRLSGKGTGALSIAEHGPHVDKVKFPDAAFVRLKVFFPKLNKSATITRKLSAPRKPVIEPADADVQAAFAEVADHPEITLSRREILRFILVEPARRSEEIQAILKLDAIGSTRAMLNTAQNRCTTAETGAAAAVKNAKQALIIHLQIPNLRAEDLLGVVNKRRTILGLTELTQLTADTQLDLGLSADARLVSFNKASALRDLKAFSDEIAGLSSRGAAAAESILASLDRLEADSGLMMALQRRNFIEKGLEFVDSPACPLCDTAWDNEEHLRAHLQSKLERSKVAQTLQQSLLDNGRLLRNQVLGVSSLIALALPVAREQSDTVFASILTQWKSELDALSTALTSIDGLTGIKEQLSRGWVGTPAGLVALVDGLRQKVEARPDPTATLEAQTFLTTAQVRLGDYRENMRKEKAAALAKTAAATAYSLYCEVMQADLDSLYDDVRTDFSDFYRAINEEDESDFTAKLTPTAGKLDFDVNFYGRGMYPPGAFHSEGHQDSMGVCLYLALMKRLFADGFTFALLDDVVMSVDAGHRREFCKLLKTKFPNTQFIITTHDRVWAEQMKTAGLVTAKTSLVFHSWTIDGGPLVESNEEIWDEIASSLAKGKVENAAACLRRHLEYLSRTFADQLGATATFKADGAYELGDLMPAALSRMKQLLGKAASAAQSWGRTAEHQEIVQRKDTLSKSNGAMNVENWAVNKAVHYNEWQNMGRRDFEPVVSAYHELLELFRCSGCNSPLHVAPRHSPEMLRCACNKISFNLTEKK